MHLKVVLEKQKVIISKNRHPRDRAHYVFLSSVRNYNPGLVRWYKKDYLTLKITTNKVKQHPGLSSRLRTFGAPIHRLVLEHLFIDYAFPVSCDLHNLFRLVYTIVQL